MDVIDSILQVICIGEILTNTSLNIFKESLYQTYTYVLNTALNIVLNIYIWYIEQYA